MQWKARMGVPMHVKKGAARRVRLWLLLALLFAAPAIDWPVWAQVPATSAPAASDERKMVIIEIDGRLCEYTREEVVEALRRYDAVREVEFLNRHGTLPVHYDARSGTPEAFADAVERALAMGWGCKA